MQERPAARPARTFAASRQREWRDDAAPVIALLVGKLVSHAVLGLLLGLVGDAVQIGFRTRAITQGFAGVVMVLLALHLLGVRRLGFLVPRPPARLGRFVRRSARSQAMAAPAVLGLLTVFIPCGVTLGVAFLAIASGSPLAGALIMSVFVLGTVPCSPPSATPPRDGPWRSAEGSARRRRPWFCSSGCTPSTAAWSSVARPSARASSLVAARGGCCTGRDCPGARRRLHRTGRARAAPCCRVRAQALEITVLDADYRAPKTVQAGRPTVVTLVTDRTRGCTRGFVVPSLGIERVLPETGRTAVDLGVLEPGRLEFTCSMGMYGGSLDVVA